MSKVGNVSVDNFYEKYRAFEKVVLEEQKRTGSSNAQVQERLGNYAKGLQFDIDKAQKAQFGKEYGRDLVPERKRYATANARRFKTPVHQFALDFDKNLEKVNKNHDYLQKKYEMMDWDAKPQPRNPVPEEPKLTEKQQKRLRRQEKNEKRILREEARLNSPEYKTYKEKIKARNDIVRASRLNGSKTEVISRAEAKQYVSVNNGKVEVNIPKEKMKVAVDKVDDIVKKGEEVAKKGLSKHGKMGLIAGAIALLGGILVSASDKSEKDESKIKKGFNVAA